MGWSGWRILKAKEASSHEVPKGGELAVELNLKSWHHPGDLDPDLVSPEQALNINPVISMHPGSSQSHMGATQPSAELAAMAQKTGCLYIVLEKKNA